MLGKKVEQAHLVDPKPGKITRKPDLNPSFSLIKTGFFKLKSILSWTHPVSSLGFIYSDHWPLVQKVASNEIDLPWYKTLIQRDWVHSLSQAITTSAK